MILFDDVVAYLDRVHTGNDEIHDWKSSTRSIDNEKEYTDQMNFY
jgi:hypothetical protein